MKRLVLILAAVCLMVPVGLALAAPGSGVRFTGCITADTETAAKAGCAAIPSANPHASLSGLAGPDAIALTVDGRFAFVASHRDASLAVFSRDTTSGKLSYVGCFTGDDFNDACTKLPGASSNAVAAPISWPTALALSPDNRSIYVTSGDVHSATVAHFERDPATGAVTYKGCITGDGAAGPAGSGACTAIPTATDAPNHSAGGFGSGLGGASGITISNDGRFAWVTAADDDAVTTLARNPATGDLLFSSCITDNPKLSICKHLPTQRGAALQGARAPLLSRDLRYLYVPAVQSGAITSFRIDSVTGALTGVGCISVAGRHRGCKHPEGSSGYGALGAPVRLIESPDDRFVYSASKYGVLGTFKRGVNGPLHLQGCITGDNQSPRLCKRLPQTQKFSYNSGIAGLVDFIFGDPKGKRLYTVARTDAAIGLFIRNVHSGKLTFKGCSTASTKVGSGRRGSGACRLLSNATKDAIGSGLYKPSALDQDGRWMYVTGSRDAAVTQLHR